MTYLPCCICSSETLTLPCRDLHARQCGRPRSHYGRLLSAITQVFAVTIDLEAKCEA